MPGIMLFIAVAKGKCQEKSQNVNKSIDKSFFAHYNTHNYRRKAMVLIIIVVAYFYGVLFKYNKY